jgi:hypothetical protein
MVALFCWLEMEITFLVPVSCAIGIVGISIRAPVQT